MIRHTRSIALAVTAVAGLAAAPAGAVTTAEPGAPALLDYTVDGFAAPIAGKVPLVFKIQGPPGAAVSLKAIPDLCNLNNQALGLACDRGSRMVTGTLILETIDPSTGIRTEVDAPMNLFRATNDGVTGFVQLPPTETGATENKPINFRGSYKLGNRLDITMLMPELPNAANIRFKGMKFTLGNSYSARVKAGKKRKGHKQRYRRVRRDMLRLPESCPTAGFWDTSVSFSFDDGTTAIAPSQVGCGGG